MAMRLHLTVCCKYCVVVGLLLVCVWLSLAGLSAYKEEEDTGAINRRADKQESDKDELFQLTRREQARRVKHVRDVCHDWGDEKHSVHKV